MHESQNNTKYFAGNLAIKHWSFWIDEFNDFQEPNWSSRIFQALKTENFVKFFQGHARTRGNPASVF